MTKAYEEELRGLVRQDERMMAVLRTVRRCQPPDWLVGAGLIRNLVWDHLHGYDRPIPLWDVDVAFFDAADLSTERDAEVTAQLTSIWPRRFVPDDFAP